MLFFIYTCGKQAPQRQFEIKSRILFCIAFGLRYLCGDKDKKIILVLHEFQTNLPKDYSNITSIGFGNYPVMVSVS
jgi:hypothetical protein